MWEPTKGDPLGPLTFCTSFYTSWCLTLPLTNIALPTMVYRQWCCCWFYICCGSGPLHHQELAIGHIVSCELYDMSDLTIVPSNIKRLYVPNFEICYRGTYWCMMSSVLHKLIRQL